MNGIASYGAHIPLYRLARSTIGEALGVASAKGSRSVASYDENSVTMAVAAAQRALDGPIQVPDRVLFATTAPPMVDRTNAADIVAALDLDHGSQAFDVMGSTRSAVGALRLALDRSAPTLVATADMRTGRPQSADESFGGDAAAAFVTGSGDAVIAEFLGDASYTIPVRHRWRVPGESTAAMWEERFGEFALVEPAVATFAEVLKNAHLTPSDLSRVLVTGSSDRAIARASRELGVEPTSVMTDVGLGNSGAAQPGVLLAAALDEPEPDRIIALVVLTEGVDVLLFRTTSAIAAPSATVAEQIAEGLDVDYLKFLTWRGFLDRQPPRRPDPVPPAPPPSLRHADWKFGLIAGRCTSCNTRNLPAQDVCYSCGHVGDMEPERIVGEKGTVATFAIDRLAYTLNPPVVTAVIDFEGGGRADLEVTDADPDTIGVGDSVELAFRVKHTSDGVPNYFWKARPVRSAG